MFSSSRRQWLGASVLSPSVDAYAGYLQRHRYRASTVRTYIHSVGHFAYWLTEQRIPLRGLDEWLVRRFATEHLPSCTCPGPRQCSAHQVRAALAHLLRVLRTDGSISAPRVALPQAIHDELERFNVHLEQVCGLALATRTSRRMWVGKFLVDRFDGAPIQVDEITARDIVDCMIRRDPAYKSGTAHVRGCALRSYLRFRALHNEDWVEPLIAAIPTVAHRDRGVEGCAVTNEQGAAGALPARATQVLDDRPPRENRQWHDVGASRLPVADREGTLVPVQVIEFGQLTPKGWADTFRRQAVA
jgi:integrase/recombinase XerD